jgi:transglutaminase-like putative cysteine protease
VRGKQGVFCLSSTLGIILPRVNANIRFDYHAARPTKTAYDVFVKRGGVCRDFAHLALTFCRCLRGY